MTKKRNKDTGRLITLTDAADFLGCSVSTVERHVAPKLERITLGKRSYLLREDVEALTFRLRPSGRGRGVVELLSSQPISALIPTSTGGIN